jgi:hypothetical protein
MPICPNMSILSADWRNIGNLLAIAAFSQKTNGKSALKHCYLISVKLKFDWMGLL